MKSLSRIAVLIVVAGLAAPAWAQAPAPTVDPALVTAAEKALATLPADFTLLEPPAAQQQIENAKPFLLDVRETAELTKGSIAGSTHIPLRELAKSLAKLPKDKAAPILAYCQVGFRGGIAMTVLRMWGYTNVRVLKGGLDAWAKAGLPVEKKS